MVRCQRCFKETIGTIMSRFNTQEICLDCETKERQHPDYPRAVKAEADAVKRGNLNFSGIGLPKDL